MPTGTGNRNSGQDDCRQDWLRSICQRLKCILFPKLSLKGALAFWTGAMARIGYALIATPKNSSMTGSFCSTNKAVKRPQTISVQHRRCVWQ